MYQHTFKLESSKISIRIDQATVDVSSGCDEVFLMLVLKTVMAYADTK